MSDALDPSWGAERIGTTPDGEVPVYQHRNGERFVIRVLGNTVGREVYGGTVLLDEPVAPAEARAQKAAEPAAKTRNPRSLK